MYVDRRTSMIMMKRENELVPTEKQLATFTEEWLKSQNLGIIKPADYLGDPARRLSTMRLWRVAEDKRMKEEAEANEKKMAEALASADVALEAALAGMPAEISVRDWTRCYGKNEPGEPPVVRTDAEGSSICCLPKSVHCCNHDRKVGEEKGTGAFILVHDSGSGEDYIAGICENARKAFEAAYHADNIRVAALRFTYDREVLESLIKERKAQAPMRRYASDIASQNVGEPPAPRHKDGEGHRLCCLPTDVCACHGEGRAARYLAFRGEVADLCAMAGEAFFQVFNETREACLLTCGDPDKAEFYASRQRQDGVVKAYWRRYAADMAEKGEPNEAPETRQNEKGEYLCGVSPHAHCCDGDDPAKGFGSYNGRVYGLCGRAGALALSVHNTEPDAARSRCLLWAKNLKDAEEIARGNNKQGDDSQSQPWRSPLGNKTERDPERRSRREQYLRDRADDDRAGSRGGRGKGKKKPKQ